MPDSEIVTPLKEAIRCLWNAEKLLHEAQAEDHNPFIIENRKEDVKRYEALVEQLQRQTIKLVLTGEGDCAYGDNRIDLGAIELLLQKGIIQECLECEEREDLAGVYDGDHREFHLSGDHHESCIDKALHEYDPERWPTYEPPTEEYDACEECGIVAVKNPTLKVKIRYTRTLTLEEVSEVNSLDEANRIAEDRSEELGNLDYTDADCEWEVTPLDEEEAILDEIASFLGIDEAFCQLASKPVVEFYSTAHRYPVQTLTLLRQSLLAGEESRAIVTQFRNEIGRLQQEQAANLLLRRAMASNATKVKAYQLIQPVGLGMSGFVERLINRPTWQEVLILIAQGRAEEAEAKASEIRESHENN
jgi:hypothetical protein